MPGQLGLVLAEAGVPPEAVEDVEQGNRRLPDTDVALVVGAHDVVNPLARVAGSALSGMPIVEVDAARQVVVLRRGPEPGFVGLGSPLLGEDRTTVVDGELPETLGRLLAAVARR
jgi:NAD(P) transhydrogenase subunit beta